MQAFRDQILDQQRAAGVRVIKPPHALGFLDPDLPRLKSRSAASAENLCRLQRPHRAATGAFQARWSGHVFRPATGS